LAGEGPTGAPHGKGEEEESESIIRADVGTESEIIWDGREENGRV